MAELKAHKGKVILTSVVTSAALAPILVNSGAVEDSEQLRLTETELLKPTANLDHLNKQSLFVIPSVDHQANSANKKIENKQTRQLTLVPRKVSLISREISNEDKERLIQNGKLNDESLETVIESPWPKDTLLSIGNRGEKVETLQEHLHEGGYYVASIDGIYGEKTKEAITQYQKDHGLKIDGIAGKETIKHLIGIKKTITVSSDQMNPSNNSVFIPEQNQHLPEVYTLSVADVQTQEQDTEIERDYYQFGDKGESIETLQTKLQKAGYYNGGIDGHFGSLTQQAVRALQREQGLAVDGLAGNEVKDFLATNNLKQIKEERLANSSSSSNQTNATEDTSSNTETSNNQPSPASGSIEAIISNAQQLIGSPYLWGGTSPSGFDCSGFLVYVYEANGTSLPRTVSDIWNASTQVSSPQRGDFVFFETYTSGPSHAGIYLGDGNFIHTGTSTGVTISNLSESYWSSRYLGAKRY
ncbi:peptidoglycan-binding protein [Bacillus shivajii]|uniref:C40 family peptidase n=1 Tax=Bacillus shivajii TaxID=1983719 RepID=UPI001CFA297C|nr:peptidoglycan-binding protein [Bacillus shivajii]UCZ51555.1 peptidoglycan-binding protein [Bacillus shivajii]